MKKALLLVNSLHPSRNHNSNLLLRVVKHMDLDVTISSLVVAHNADGSFKNVTNSNPPHSIDGFPASFTKVNAADRLISRLLARISNNDRACTLVSLIKLYWANIFRARHADIVLSTYQSIVPSFAASQLAHRRKQPIKALYLMDPTDSMYDDALSVADEHKRFLKMLKNTDIVFTTPFIKKAMVLKGHAQLVDHIVEVSFPMITDFPYTSHQHDPNKITLLYCGSLYLQSKIRSPEYFFKIISRLDERFRVVIVGWESQKALAQFPIQTSAEVIALPQMKYDDLMQIMADSDVLINLGNSVPVHLPSKTLEFINTGKPIVNFYKLDSCPTLHYTRRYPLCLNLNEKDTDIDNAAEKFISFCIGKKGKSLDRAWIKQNYADSTPEEIARRICEECSKLNNNVNVKPNSDLQ